MATLPLLHPRLINEDEGIDALGVGFSGDLDTGTPPSFVAGNIVKLSSGKWVRAAAEDNATLAMAKEPAQDAFYKGDTKDVAATSTVKSRANFVKLGNQRVIISTSPSTALTSGHLTGNTAYALGYDSSSGCHFLDNGNTNTPCLTIEALLDRDTALTAKYITGAPAGSQISPSTVYGGVGDKGVRVIARFTTSTCY